MNDLPDGWTSNHPRNPLSGWTHKTGGYAAVNPTVDGFCVAIRTPQRATSKEAVRDRQAMVEALSAGSDDRDVTILRAEVAALRRSVADHRADVALALETTQAYRARCAALGEENAVLISRAERSEAHLRSLLDLLTKSAQ